MRAESLYLSEFVMSTPGQAGIERHRFNCWRTSGLGVSVDIDWAVMLAIATYWICSMDVVATGVAASLAALMSYQDLREIVVNVGNSQCAGLAEEDPTISPRIWRHRGHSCRRGRLRRALRMGAPLR